MFLYKVIARADDIQRAPKGEESEYVMKEIQMVMEERPKMYVGEGKRIAKNKLLEVFPMYSNDATMVGFATYVLEEDLEKAHEILKEEVTQTVMKLKFHIDRMVQSIQREPMIVRRNAEIEED